jgi:hypothetical protein
MQAYGGKDQLRKLIYGHNHQHLPWGNKYEPKPFNSHAVIGGQVGQI